MGTRPEMSQGRQPPVTTKIFDPSARFVRVRQVRADGLVEFDFAVGEPNLSVELILPLAAFHEFCSANQVTRIASIEDATSTPPHAAGEQAGVRAAGDHCDDPRRPPCR